MWPDAIPSLLPQVDLLIVGRDQLAPRGFLRRKRDTVLIRWEDVAGLIHRHSSVGATRGFLLNYQSPPADVSEYIKGIRASSPKLEIIAEDAVLDAELVAKYTT